MSYETRPLLSNEIFWDLSLKKISIKNREKYTNLVKVTLPMVLIVWKNNLRNLNSLQALWDSETAFNNEIKYWDFYDNSTLTDSSFPYKMTELKNEFSENWFRVAKASDDHISYLEYLFYLYSNKISSDVRKREVYNLALTKLCEYVESNRNDDISFFWYYFNLFNGNKMVKLDHWKYIKSNYAVGFPFHINPKNIYDEFLKRFRIAKIELELAGKIEGFQQKDENITIPKIKKYFIDNLHSSLSELDLLDKTGQVGLRLSLNIEPTNWVTINKNDPFIGVIDRPPSTIYSIQPVLFGTATFYSLFSGNKLFEYQFGYGKTNLIRASTNQWDVIKREIKLTIFDLLILMSKDGISPKQTLKMLEKHKNLFISDEGNQLEIEIQEVVEIINGKTSFPVSKDTEPIVFPSSVEYKEPISWLFQKIQNRRLHIPTKSIDADQ